MSAHAQRLKLRLFLEGVEVPVIAAQVQVAPNAPAMASIQIPPLAEGTYFKPRTLVHLFFLDFYETQSPLISMKGQAAGGYTASPSANTPSAYEQQISQHESGVKDDYILNEGGDELAADFVNERYKLLFGGEIVGFQWSKNVNNRSLVLQCQDWSNYWDYAYQFSNTDLFGPGYKALFSGGSTNLFTDFLETEGSVIAQIIQQKSIRYPALEGLLGGIVHLLEAIGGSYYYDKKINGQNIFFSLAELRLHITQMITAFEGDPTAKRLLNAGGFDGLFGRTLGNLGQQVSIRKAINALMGVIFHETYAQTCPLYSPGEGGTVSGFVRKKVKDDPASAFIATTATGVITGLEEAKTYLSAPLFAESDRQTMISKLSDAKKTLQSTAQKIRAKQIQQALSYYSSAQSSVGQALSAVKAARGSNKTDKFRSGVRGKLDGAIEQMQKAVELEINTTPKKKAIPARLNAQIFRPDVWFSAPPMCNVLFPEQYLSVNYTRMFLQEPTRLMLKTNDEFFGEDELFDNFYFAPKAFGLKTSKNTLTAMLSNDLMDHELYTGILPIFEKMGELNIFAARSGTINGKQPKVGLAQRSCNFLYFKYRFAARQMQIAARFNPYIAIGFPGLVIDKWADTEILRRYNELAGQIGRPTRDMNKMLGAHFLGNFTEVSHTVDQQQGRTEINCGYPRQPDESVEFLGAIESGQTVKKRFDKDALRSTDVAALNPPRLYALGPNFGQIVEVLDVTDVYGARGVAKEGDGAMALPLYAGSRRQGTGELKTEVPVNVVKIAREYGPEVVELMGDSGRPVTFRAYRIKEEVPRYRREVVDLPAEEYIRPGWYGDIWHPSKIGEAYRHFFRTGAITDPTQIADPDGTSTGAPNDAASDALAEAAKGTDAGDPRVLAPALLALEANSSIEQAVAFLVLTYSYVKTGALDAEEFVRAYCWRPIASICDMFGTSDLQLSPDGTQVVSGIEGFHSRAFGPFNDIFGLVTPEIESILGIKKGSTVSQKGDKRKDKQQAVLDYVSALTFSRALLG